MNRYEQLRERLEAPDDMLWETLRTRMSVSRVTRWMAERAEALGQRTLHGYDIDLHLFRKAYGAGAPVIVNGLTPDGQLRYQYLFSDHNGVAYPAEMEVFDDLNAEGLYRLTELRGTRAEFVARWLREVQDRSPAEIQTLMGPACPDFYAKMEETMATERTLYQVILPADSKAEARFGEKIATTREGKFVLEMKGENGKVETFAKNELTEVLPYTVLFAGSHWEVEEGSLTKGDILLFPEARDFFIVEKIDTKSKNRKHLPVGVRKVLSEPIT